MWVKRGLTAAALTIALCGAARAESCGPLALGVSRVIAVGAPAHLGLKTYPETLDLKDHEVVLTFDDGPAPTTRRILDALEKQCAKATFFVIGRNAGAMPQIVRREIADGDTVASHSNTHPMLRALPFGKAMADIDAGAAAVEKASGGKASKFFRFPGFADSPALLDALDKKQMPVFGADLWASDWNVMTPKDELDLLMGRLRRAGSGIILLHDTKKETAEMLPAFLAALKAEGYHLVQLTPGDAPPALRHARSGWKSETEATLKEMGIGEPRATSATTNVPPQDEKKPTAER